MGVGINSLGLCKDEQERFHLGSADQFPYGSHGKENWVALNEPVA